jgi:AcrR family transcriptional regulator
MDSTSDATGHGTLDRRPTGSAVLRESVTETIRRAVFEELAETGYARMSMEAVTRRARVGKAALYRRWPSKEAMVVELVSEAAAAHLPAPAGSGSLSADVARFVRDTVADLSHPLVGRIIPDLVAESARNPSLREALHTAVLAPRRAAVAALLRQAVERGELPAGIDMGLAVDLFGAPLYFRMLAVGGPTDEAYVTRLTHAVLAALAASH